MDLMWVSELTTILIGVDRTTLKNIAWLRHILYAYIYICIFRKK